MPQMINTNIASLNAQRNLNTSQASLNTALQRLSSGLRINSAKDDAAGLAISERMTAQIRGLDQAARNGNDGISLAQTAEGALNAIGDNLQRIRELAVQAANASNSTSDRASLNAEASQLISEINRVATTTQFNGVNLLDGTFVSQAFQVGANAGQTITISSIASAKADSLGVGSASSYSTTVTGSAVATNALAAGSVTLNGYQVGASSTDGVSYSYATGSAIAKAAAINAVSGNTGVTATVGATSLAGTAVAATSAIAGSASDYVKINGVSIGAVAAGGSAVEIGSNVAAAINKVSAQTGVTATFSTSTGAVALSAADGRNITIEQAGGHTAASTGLGAVTGTTTAAITLTSSSSAGITVGGDNESYAGLTAGYTAATATAGAGVSSLDLTTAAGATSALTIIDSALNTVNSSRGSLGAYQNRFSSTVANLQTNSENLSAARSRIRDADFAAETANMTRGQILQQAGVAMLAQANALPNNVLTLLR